MGGLRLHWWLLARLKLLIYACLLFFIFMLGKMVFLNETLRDIIIDFLDKKSQMRDTVLKPSDWADNVLSVDCHLHQVRVAYFDYFKEISQASEIRDVRLFTMQGTPCRLMDHYKPGRPLVMYFGSCTCPTFMAKLNSYTQLVQEYGEVADFVVIYIEEAHVVGEHELNNNIRLCQPVVL